ncbi:alpha/beta hydrolase [Gordonia sp. NPDC003585]|uniref:alpha/beta hydrolase n=1 Tax=Gordonia sp. NPDC003585 TaxID=3154275 RepID=UPI0033A653C5
MGRFDGVGTLYRVFRGEQVGEPFATPHVVVADGRHRLLKRYDPTGTRIDAPPVLLIPPLAVSSSCYDLAPGLSFIEFLTSTGRTVYLVDFGDMDRTDRDLGFAGFFADIVPEAIRRVIGDSGAEMVDLVAWSIGGTLGFLTLAADPGLPVRSMTAVGTPLDYAPVAMYRLGRALTRPTNGKAITVVLRALGGIPAPVVRTVYRATAWQRELKKPGYIMSNADNPDALARMQAIDRFQATMPGYPGKVSEEMWENFVYRAELAGGTLHFGDRVLELSSITQPIALFGSHRDAIVSWEAAHHGVELFDGAQHVEFTTVESSHLGLIAGSDAVAHTWPRIDEFLRELDSRPGGDGHQAFEAPR